MRALTDTELLSVWERGRGLPAVQQALQLLAAASPETPQDDWALLSIGRRDASLLALRECIFGSRIVSLASCPACDESAEIAFEVAQVLTELPSTSAATLTLHASGCDVQFRLPNSLDLAAIANADSIEAGRATLLDRCLLSVECRGEKVVAAQLPVEIAGEVAARMSAADPQADVRLVCNCPACGHSWQAVFDVASFFWAEISAWANRTLREIHLLASAYGWREADILTLSPTRRRLYLELVGT